MSLWKPGIWKKGKDIRTGTWRYDRNNDCFWIELDKPVAYGLPGERKRIITIFGEDSPDIGKWIYQHKEITNVET